MSYFATPKSNHRIKKTVTNPITNKKHVNTIVGVVYRHPRKTSDETFLSYLEKTLTSIGKENKNAILMGDFNYCLLKYDCDNWVKNFVDLTNENKIATMHTRTHKSCPRSKA